MLTGTLIYIGRPYPDIVHYIVPNVWVRPPNQRHEADKAKSVFKIPDSDHLTLLNVFNQYYQSMSFDVNLQCDWLITTPIDKYDENWTRQNYLSRRALQEAENVRKQLQQSMERFEIELLSISDQKQLYLNIRQALVCGFFMQIAHKEGGKGNYLTVKDNQVCFFVIFCLFSVCSNTKLWY
jgi:pre-mRNA-splicing factor ATP-dependent RNA helicase DHX15/PRP43